MAKPAIVRQRASEMRTAIDMIEGSLMGFGDLVDLPKLFDGHDGEVRLKITVTVAEMRRVCTALSECTRIINSEDFSPDIFA